MGTLTRTEIRTPGNPLRDPFHLLWTGVLSSMPVRVVARLAVRRELLKGSVLAGMLGSGFDFLLDRVSKDPLYCIRARHELLRLLRLRKNFPPGWRKACFDASARWFGPLT